ncbi:MAG: tRNA uridine-5-carboxymethylaminomethyl(34) synthesis enzyme MnmG [Phycisphaerales bacterium]
MNDRFEVIVIGGGHAGVEAAWAAANILRRPGVVALVTQDAAKIGVMSCNPAIGGLAKGQMVREIDALGGLMGLATDGTGIQFRVLNTSKGPAVHGPRAQCDKHAYADEVQRLLASRAEIVVVAATVESLLVQGSRIRGVRTPQGDLIAPAVVLTTGTFMRGLLHTGESKHPGGRHGEAPAVGIAGSLNALGFELGRLKTGTPPRLRRGSINWESLEEQLGDPVPTPFSDLSGKGGWPFPRLRQVDCRMTTTTPEIHDAIRANLHRAPMYSGQIECIGPRYCPSIEDKVVRFAERERHGVYLEPESLRDDWVYCNGISTSLPADVQERIVRGMPGCEGAEILRFGYAVEYDMVKPHQIRATCMTRAIEGLFLAGQINGTSGYEEAAAQGVVAGLNAARSARGEEHVILSRDRGYIGVMMDDLVTKTPVEPYRMFTSRAEHRLTLRADNAADRLTPLAITYGLVNPDCITYGQPRIERYERRRRSIDALDQFVEVSRFDGKPLAEALRRPEFTPAMLGTLAGDALGGDAAAVATVHTNYFYAEYTRKAERDAAASADLERRSIPTDFDFAGLTSMRTEARQALARFRPDSLGQAIRLEGITPADITLLSVLIRRHRDRPRINGSGE